MLCTENLLLDLERLAKERFGFGEFVQCPVELAQVIEARGGEWMQLAVGFAMDLECPLKKGFGLPLIAHRLVQQGQVVDVVCRSRVVLTDRLRVDFERLPKERLRL
jgi:hypothetical protein